MGEEAPPALLQPLLIRRVELEPLLLFLLEEEALKLHEEALAFRKRVLPEDHPSIAPSMNTLAAKSSKRGTHKEALELQASQEALAHSDAAERPTESTPTMIAFAAVASAFHTPMMSTRTAAALKSYCRSVRALRRCCCCMDPVPKQVPGH